MNNTAVVEAMIKWSFIVLASPNSSFAYVYPLCTQAALPYSSHKTINAMNQPNMGAKWFIINDKTFNGENFCSFFVDFQQTTKFFPTNIFLSFHFLNSPIGRTHIVHDLQSNRSGRFTKEVNKVEHCFGKLDILIKIWPCHFKLHTWSLRVHNHKGTAWKVLLNAQKPVGSDLT